ncbi:hypothetical protein CIB84_006446, partial [Bambusicola thoracicus]
QQCQLCCVPSGVSFLQALSSAELLSGVTGLELCSIQGTAWPRNRMDEAILFQEEKRFLAVWMRTVPCCLLSSPENRAVRPGERVSEGHCLLWAERKLLSDSSGVSCSL